MNRVLIAVLATAGACLTRPAEDFVPASSNIVGAAYPRTHADGRVTFRGQARDAQKVQLRASTTTGSSWTASPPGPEFQTWRRSLHDFAPRLFR